MGEVERSGDALARVQGTPARSRSLAVCEIVMFGDVQTTLCACEAVVTQPRLARNVRSFGVSFFQGGARHRARPGTINGDLGRWAVRATASVRTAARSNTRSEVRFSCKASGSSRGWTATPIRRCSWKCAARAFWWDARRRSTHCVHHDGV